MALRLPIKYSKYAKFQLNHVKVGYPAVLLCVSMRAMYIKKVVQTWLTGWRDLFFYDSVPVYEMRGWLDRKRLDHVALWHLFGLVRFRCAVLSLVAVQLLVLSLSWHWDLEGWRRDLLRTAPMLFVLPWFATARKVAVESMLRKPDR